MTSFDKAMQTLLIAKVSAMEQALKEHHPETFSHYWASLVALVRDLDHHEIFEGLPDGVKERILENFQFPDSPVADSGS